MTVASTTSKSGPYACNGVTVAFALGFACQSQLDLQVVRTDSLMVDNILVLATDYTVALNADQAVSPGGTVTLLVAPATGNQITILRAVQTTQGASLPNQGGWYPKVVENALDKLTMLTQQLAEQVGRAIKVGVASSQTPDQLIATLNTNAASAVASATSATASASSATASASSASSSATAAAASAAASGVPSMSGNSGKFTTNNGSVASWAFITNTFNIVKDSLTTTYGYTGANLTTVTETINAINKVTTLTYNADNTVNVVTITYNGKTRTETYAYTSGKISGMTVVEI